VIKIAQLKKSAQTVSSAKKCQNINNKAQFESLKHFHQTTFETLKYLQQCFGTSYLSKNVIDMFHLKLAQNVAIIWATSSFQKVMMSLQK
jgi:hypothetical protein